MPRGSYLHLDPYDGTALAIEAFSCAPGPAGWRYVSRLTDPAGTRPVGSVDVTVDGGWRQIRVEVRAGGWVVRGGVVRDGVTWLRWPDGAAAAADSAATERRERAAGFASRSPAFLVASARLLRPPPRQRSRMRVVVLTEPALGSRVVEQVWTLADVTEHDTGTGPLTVDHYTVGDLGTGEVRDVHLAGDVVLDAPGLVLRQLDSPPTPPPALLPDR